MPFSKLFNIVQDSISHLVFPQLCLHCHSLLEEHILLCPSCLELLTLIDPNERCKSCFLPLKEVEHICEESPLFLGLAAAFEARGPAMALLLDAKLSNSKDLANLMASFMVIQWHRLNWPIPDLITFVPSSKKWDASSNFSFLLAQEIGRMLERPVGDVLKYRGWEFSKMKLNRRQRRELCKHSFQWKEPLNISDQTLLIIDDSMSTRTSMSNCAQKLHEGYPKGIYGLSFCSED